MQFLILLLLLLVLFQQPMLQLSAVWSHLLSCCYVC
jgi:hypothetical protein